MEELEWRNEYISAGEYIMREGGEVHFKVIKRGKERIPELRIYPDNYIRCKTEFLVID